MMRITYFGHSCFQFEIGESKILIDPFISGNPLAAHIDMGRIRSDYIFVTHGHGDHLMDVEALAKPNTPIITNYEVANWFTKKGLNAIGYNYGGTWSGPFGTVKFVSALHSSSLPDGSYGGNPVGFVFNTPVSNFYIAGDTALNTDMKLIPMLCGTIDFCILPIGGHFTMDTDEAVHAAKFVGCNQVIGCHFDTFVPIQINQQKTIETFEKANLSLKLPAIGETFDI